jgi:flagellar protein FliL
VIALVVIAGGGVAAWYAMEKSAPTKDATLPQEKPSVFVTLEPFTVNLQPENGDQYLQVGLVLKVTESVTADAVKLQMPEIRNRILLLLTSKKASDISTVAGKQLLSTEIMGEIKQSVAPQKIQQGIINVFFTSFVIQ